jgi:hypothetical protein
MSTNGRPKGALNGLVNGRLTPKQEAVALLLASGRSEDEAAERARCGSRTIRKWLHGQPAFPRRVAALRAAMTSQALGRLTAAMSRAADTLDTLASSAESETVRLGAARSVIELAVRLRETVELEERVAALEQRHGNGNGRTR